MSWGKPTPLEVAVEERLAAYLADRREPQLPGMEDAGNYQTRVRGEGPYVLLNAHLDIVEGCLGGDDRCGLAIIAGILEATDLPCKVLLTTAEEHGVDPEWPEGFLDDCLFALVLDRSGVGDIVTSGGGRQFCSDRFGAWVLRCAQEMVEDPEFYALTKGRWSHAVGLSKHLETVNLSVGFYKEHTPEESVRKRATMRAAVLVAWLIERRAEWNP